MINAVGVPQSILVLGGSSEIGLAITAEYLSKGPARVILATLPGDPTADAAVEKAKNAGATEVTQIDFDARATDTHRAVIDKAFADGDARHFSKIFSGRHVGLDGVVSRRCRTVRLETPDVVPSDVEAFADALLLDQRFAATRAQDELGWRPATTVLTPSA